jgi:hypothetical protein
VQAVECRLGSTLLEDLNERRQDLADTDALRPLVAAALHQSAHMHLQQEEQQTMASQHEQLTAFRTRLEAALSAPVRQALDLHYEWGYPEHRPRAVFWLEIWRGPAECALYFNEEYRIWGIRMPHPYQRIALFESRALEQRLLVAIGEFWKAEEMDT